MAGFKISPQQLSSLGGSCDRTASDVRSRQVALRGQLTPLLDTDWSDAEANQFAELYQQFDNNARAMTAALEEIGQLLGHAGHRHAAGQQGAFAVRR